MWPEAFRISPAVMRGGRNYGCISCTAEKSFSIEEVDMLRIRYVEIPLQHRITLKECLPPIPKRKEPSSSK
jgi:hypothetical protein